MQDDFTEAAIRQAWADRLWKIDWRQDEYGSPEGFIEAEGCCFACGLEGSLTALKMDGGAAPPSDRHLLCDVCLIDAKAAILGGKKLFFEENGLRDVLEQQRFSSLGVSTNYYPRWFNTRRRIDALLSEAIRKGINPSQVILNELGLATGKMIETTEVHDEATGLTKKVTALV